MLLAVYISLEYKVVSPPLRHKAVEKEKREPEMSLFTQALLGFVVFYPIYHIYCTWRNVLKARSTGLPYIVTPWNGHSLHWMFLEPILIPWLKKLPGFIVNPWISYIEANWEWRRKHDVYKDMKSDLFWVISGSIMVLWVSDADVVNEIITRRDDFTKPGERYAVLDLFGSNVLSTTGKHWRAHRKITAPPFNEKNNLEALKLPRSGIYRTIACGLLFMS